MKIFRTIDSIYINKQIYLTIGSYDGIHAGHRKVISELVDYAHSQNGLATVLTFSNHPLSVINPHRAPKRILTNQERIEKLAQLGVDALIELKFTRTFSETTAADFAALVRKYLKPREIFAGPDCAFGKNGEGSSGLLRDSGFCVRIFDVVRVDGQIVSSTAIRKYINQGNVKEASRLLGYPYSMSGYVIDGLKRGRLLGYPTINVDFPSEKIEPAFGVYITKIKLPGGIYNGITNFGMSPTVDAGQLRLETHIFNFSEDVYGEFAVIELLDYVRPETAFDSLADLKAQMREDCAIAKDFFQNCGS